ncbi:MULTISPECIES: phage terminase small subunit P27 family [Bradyrhizobium]|uniref:Phage terminase small subunit P27 family n=1 Tax=Bradyrhizobium septentrionale TaxID=1404411 RepID=A0A973VW92_9BRAD|nr:MULTISPECIES: phage terminase small subunit P27 family [Bradyrhizobium]QIG97772.1 phage terminase small subunit P27 family [Bradyrhizobium sp. 6(2017)]UGY20231.1 phage terminase small subunit P27 family [Bradyrhizobium septentrionale]UGY29070.1 phage terminase small subunit P27 family [Bradyrhizobium septentrionale]
MPDEPQPEQLPDVPEPPPFITGYAADEWWRTAPELHRLGLLTVVDIPALATYCHAFGQWRLASEALARMQSGDPVMHGLIIKSKIGDAVQNPLVSIVRKHAGDVVRFAAEFGLTPAARSRISAGIHGDNSQSKFAGLLAG